MCIGPSLISFLLLAVLVIELNRVYHIWTCGRCQEIGEPLDLSRAKHTKHHTVVQKSSISRTHARFAGVIERYIYIYIFIYLYIISIQRETYHIYIYICIYTYLCIYLFIYIYIYAYAYASLSLFLSLSISLSIYILFFFVVPC